MDQGADQNVGRAINHVLPFGVGWRRKDGIGDRKAVLNGFHNHLALEQRSQIEALHPHDQLLNVVFIEIEDKGTARPQEVSVAVDFQSCPEQRHG